MRHELVDLPGRAAEPRLAGLSAFLDAEPDRAGDTGLTVAVEVTNAGEREIALLNPFALLQFDLRDGAGFPMDLPVAPSPLLIDPATDADWAAGAGVPVLDVRWSGITPESNTPIGRVLLLPPGVAVRVTFVLDRALLGTPPVETPLPAGDYTLGAVLTLIDADGSDASRILHGGGLAVRYGRPAE